MTAPFKPGDELTCVDRSPDARLTVGKTYVVQKARPDGSYVSVVNDERRLTQYAATRFSKGSPVVVRANALIPINPGQWVLAYVEHFYPGHFDRDMACALESLVKGGSGWDCIYDAGDQFEVLQVERVMPKTYLTVEGERRLRDLVFATASPAGELLALRDKLFAIGFAADRAIQEETARRMASFTAKTRAAALAKVHAALPHIFGSVTENKGYGGRTIVHP